MIDSILGSEYNEIFYKLYAGFLLQSASFKLSRFCTKKHLREYLGNNVDFTNIISNYPLPSFFQQTNSDAVAKNTALKMVLMNYNSATKSLFKFDRSGSVSYFAVPTGSEVFSPKDNLMVFSLKDVNIYTSRTSCNRI